MTRDESNRHANLTGNLTAPGTSYAAFRSSRLHRVEPLKLYHHLHRRTIRRSILPGGPKRRAPKAMQKPGRPLASPIPFPWGRMGSRPGDLAGRMPPGILLRREASKVHSLSRRDTRQSPRCLGREGSRQAPSASDDLGLRVVPARPTVAVTFRVCQFRRGERQSTAMPIVMIVIPRMSWR